MAEYHVGCGAFGIYAGTLMPNGKLWRNKTDVTDEAIAAVRDWLLGEFIKGGETRGGYEWRTKDGRRVSVIVEVEEAQDGSDSTES